MFAQNDLIVIVPIRRGAEETLSEALERIYKDLDASEEIPFLKLTTVHFIRWAILPAAPSRVYELGYPASLVLSSNFDGRREDHLRELVNVARDGIDRIYECCEGYPEGADRTDDQRIGYLLERALPRSDIYYRGHPGLTVEQIHQDQSLRMEIDQFLEKAKLGGFSALEIRDAIGKKVGSKCRPALETRPPPVPQGFSGAEKLVGGALFLIFAPFLAVWLYLTRQKEKGDSWEPVAGTKTGPTDPAVILEREDFIAQNQFTHVVEIKPGWIRKMTLRAILFVIHTAGFHYFTRGNLGGVSTLHFVSWSIIDEGQRLLFLSNYDGSALNYVADFVDRAWAIPLALTALWSNTIGFPETRWLIGEGAKHMPPFLSFLRDHQKHAPVWFSAYPELTTGNIIINEKIRRGLFADLTRKEAEAWLRLI